MIEKWKRVKDYPDCFVSTCGRVYNARLNKMLKQSLRNGYYRVSINGKSFSTHRLVAQTFIPNPNNLETVDHIGNKLDNRVENLRWLSRPDNTKRFYQEQITETQIKERRERARSLSEIALEAAHKATKKTIVCLETGETYESINQAGRTLGIDPGNICKVLKGKFKHTNNLHFIYAKEQ